MRNGIDAPRKDMIAASMTFAMHITRNREARIVATSMAIGTMIRALGIIVSNTANTVTIISIIAHMIATIKANVTIMRVTDLKTTYCVNKVIAIATTRMMTYRVLGV